MIPHRNILVFILAMFFTQCRNRPLSDRIIGTWTGTLQDPKLTVTLTFTANQMICSYSDTKAKIHSEYKIVNDTLNVLSHGLWEKHAIANLSNDELRIAAIEDTTEMIPIIDVLTFKRLQHHQ
jgi:hypothetical protein